MVLTRVPCDQVVPSLDDPTLAIVADFKKAASKFMPVQVTSFRDDGHRCILPSMKAQECSAKLLTTVWLRQHMACNSLLW